MSIITLAFLTGCNPQVIVEGSSVTNLTESITISSIPTTFGSSESFESSEVSTDFSTSEIEFTTTRSTETSITETSETSITGVTTEVTECGNFKLESGEECDEGPIATRTCDVNCKLVLCGNGIVSEFEECDDGNDDDYDDCSNDCHEPRWVFLTSDYIGPANFGGLMKADEFCQNDANKFGLVGKYLAWLSDDDPLNSPIFRFESEDFKGWYRMRSPFPTPLAKGWIGLTTSNLESNLNITPSGISDQNTAYVWSSTNADGSRSEDSTCDNWTFLGAGQNYVVSLGSPQIKIAPLWTSSSIKECASGVGAKLYCFEVK